MSFANTYLNSTHNTFCSIEKSHKRNKSKPEFCKDTFFRSNPFPQQIFENRKRSNKTKKLKIEGRTILGDKLQIEITKKDKLRSHTANKTMLINENLGNKNDQ